MAPKPLTFNRFFDWNFDTSIEAIQGHIRIPGNVSEEALGERLTIERCRQLGQIFHASYNSNYESIREGGLLLSAVRSSGQRHRLAIHFVYAEQRSNQPKYLLEEPATVASTWQREDQREEHGKLTT